MSVYRRFPSEELPSLVTTNTLARQPIFRSRDTCELFLRILYEVRVETGFQLLAFSIMPDHVHLVLVPGEQNLGRILQLIKGRFSRAYNKTQRQSGPLLAEPIPRTGAQERGGALPCHGLCAYQSRRRPIGGGAGRLSVVLGERTVRNRPRCLLRSG